MLRLHPNITETFSSGISKIAILQIVKEPFYGLMVDQAVVQWMVL